MPAGVCAGQSSVDVAVVGDPQTGVAVYSGTWQVFGGTSAGAPIVSAMYAVADPVPDPTDPQAYPYAHRSLLADVTSGNTGNCAVALLCVAGVGWDGPSGIGSPVSPAAFSAATEPGSGGSGSGPTPPPADPPPVTDPVTVSVRNPGTVHSDAGRYTSVDVHATTTGSPISLRYTASPLPYGMALRQNGTIAGRPRRAGTYSVTVRAAASPGPVSSSTTFLWRVSVRRLVPRHRPHVYGIPTRGHVVRVARPTWHTNHARGVMVRPTVRYQWYLGGRALRNTNRPWLWIPRTGAFTGRALTVRVTAWCPWFVPFSVVTARTPVAR